MRLKKNILLLFLIVCSLYSVTASPSRKEQMKQIEQRAGHIYNSYKVKVIYKYNKFEYFSKYQRRSPTIARGVQADLGDTLIMLSVIEYFLATFDKKLILDNLNSIYLTKELSFRGKEYGGTYSYNCIYVNIQNLENEYLMSYALMTLFHEFSSVLLYNFNEYSPEKEWVKINDPGFRYSGHAINVLHQDNLHDQNEEYYQSGFLIEYCKTNFENDFNVYAQWYFTKKEKLVELASKYEKIKLKYDLFDGFINNILSNYKK